jgi:ferredoxin
MADTTVTGGSDDVRIDASRCLRMRYSDSACHRCVAACPHGSVTVADRLVIDPGLCRGCQLCTTVCPAGALEPMDDFTACLAQLAKVPEPVLGCIRTKDRSHTSISCLGGLSPEHLMSLIQTMSGVVTLNLSLCADCGNAASISLLRERLNALTRAGLTVDGAELVLVAAAEEIHFHDTTVDRRGFFKLFRRSLVESASAVLAVTKEQPETPIAYSIKRLPIRRNLLNRTRASLSPEMVKKCREQFDVQVTWNDTCTACQGCVAICPTGALQTVSDAEQPVFDCLSCTGCGLCVEFCLDGAVHLQPFT